MRSCKQFAAAILLIFGVAMMLSACRSISRLVDKGGTVFLVRLEGEPSNRSDLTDGAIRVIERKIDAVGLDGEVAAVPGKHGEIEVKIYGSNDLQVLRRFLFITHRLELKKAVSPPFPSPLQQYPTKEAAEKNLTTDQEVLKLADSDYGGSTPQFVIVEKMSIITGEGIRDAHAVSRTDLEDDYQISFSLNKEGAAKFGEWTGRNIGNYLAVVLNGEVQSAAYIRGQIFDSGQIDGRFTKASAEEIALSLRSGYFPSSLTIVSETPF